MKSSLAEATMMAAMIASGSNAMAVTRFSDPFVNLVHEAPPYRRVKYSRGLLGKASPAGSKLARKAAKGKVGVR